MGGEIEENETITSFLLVLGFAARRVALVHSGESINAVRSLTGIIHQPKGGHCYRMLPSVESARLVILSLLWTLRLPSKGTVHSRESQRREPPIRPD
jgi:hypothetical protein